MADSPKWAEAAQALFSAVLDYEGKTFDPKPRNYAAFKKAYGKQMKAVDRHVKHPGVSISQIEQNLTRDQDWYDSSINIANKIFTETKNIARKTHNRIKPAGIELFYLRDEGKGSVMGSIDTIFTHVNNTVKQKNKDTGSSDLTFSNLNKWSPADIYIASVAGKKLLVDIASGKPLKQSYKLGKLQLTSLSNFVTFGIFNDLLRRMITKGDLIPISLKKAPHKVVVKTINFIPGDVSRALEKNDVRYHGYIFSKTNDVYNSKDVYIKVTNSHSLQFRDKGGTGGGLAPVHSYQCIITGGKQSLDGSMAGDGIGRVLGVTIPAAGRFYSGSHIKEVIRDSKKIAGEMFKDMETNSAYDDNGKIAFDPDYMMDESVLNNKICNNVYKWAKAYTTQSFGTKQEFFTNLYKHDQYGREGTATKAGVQNAILTQRALAQFLFGKYLGGRLITFFETATSVKKNEMAINLVLYTGSRTKQSSPHFKASDPSSF
jgi:hypothetical protein